MTTCDEQTVSELIQIKAHLYAISQHLKELVEFLMESKIA